MTFSMKWLTWNAITAVCLIFISILIVYGLVLARHQRTFYMNAECPDFAEWRMNLIPARCLPGWLDR